MAGQWIKFDSSTPDKPEVLRAARILGVDRDLVVGKLLKLWAWFDSNSTDGNVDGVVDADVDAVVGMSGFCAALKSVGWYESDEAAERASIPNFDRHNGETAKRRAEKNARQARWRGKSDVDQSGTHTDRHVDEGASTRASTTASTREDKSREDKKEKKKKEPAAAPPPGLDPESWLRWSQYRREIGKPIKPASIPAAQTQMAAMGARQREAVEQSIANGWQGLFAPRGAPGAVAIRSKDDMYQAIRELTQ
jgi:hypothetical protein